ncbi:hypothetical protein, partial [Methylocapsa sp. S129]|uniref:hypothetical protein n=1 Tax=Methylocapsa sp. S129 TaxID=1641869 RepID=UPI00131D85EA
VGTTGQSGELDLQRHWHGAIPTANAIRASKSFRKNGISGRVAMGRRADFHKSLAGNRRNLFFPIFLLQAFEIAQSHSCKIWRAGKLLNLFKDPKKRGFDAGVRFAFSCRRTSLSAALV